MFTASLKLKLEPFQIVRLNKDYAVCNKLYNRLIYFVQKQVAELMKTKKYRYFTKVALSTKEEKEKKAAYKEIRGLIVQYGLRKWDLDKVIKSYNKKFFQGKIKSDVLEKMVEGISVSVEKAIFQGTEIHFRRWDDSNSMSSKRGNRTIIFDPKTLTVKYDGMVLAVKPIRELDFYLHEAITFPITYAKLVRKPKKNGWSYYVQLLFKENSPKRLKKGTSVTGLDQGTTTLALANQEEVDFIELAPHAARFNKQIVSLQRKISRSLYYNNLDKMVDGRYPKGTKLLKTKRCRRLQHQLKALYAKKSRVVKQEHNRLANHILSMSAVIVKEKMNWRALAKQSQKPTERSGKVRVVKNKSIPLFKRKKRYGKSLNNASPGYLDATIQAKAALLDVPVIEVDMLQYRASQYRHDSDTYVKPKLSERVKEIDGQLVQRDLYSAFLLACYQTEKQIDRAKCIETFPRFIQLQTQLLNEKTFSSKNFGLTL